MDLSIVVDGSCAMIALTGKLTAATAPELDAAVKGISEDVASIDIDMAGLDYIASAGLRVLVGAEKMAKQRGGKVRLLHPISDVMDILDLTGLVAVFEVVE